MSIAIEKTKNPQAQTAKHTPGPWKVWHGSRSVYAHNDHIADIVLPQGGENCLSRTPELVANAKLIQTLLQPHLNYWKRCACWQITHRRNTRILNQSADRLTSRRR